jgi:hypothetical protein
MANSKINKEKEYFSIFIIFMVKNKRINLIYLDLGDNGEKLLTWSIFYSEDDAGLHLWTILPLIFLLFH